MLDEEALEEQCHYWHSNTDGPTYRPLVVGIIERGMKGELEGMDVNYHEFGDGENWETLSEIKRIVRLKEKRKEEEMLAQDKKEVRMSQFQGNPDNGDEEIREPPEWK